MNWDSFVIGGGLAGLAAATWLGRAGQRVLLLERGRELGGRARSQVEQGYTFNLGPHALYAEGPAHRALLELGVEVSGHPPRLGGLALRGGKTSLLPVGPASLLRTRLLGWGEKLELARWLAGLASLDSAPLAEVPAKEWLEGTFRGAAARELVGALLRLSSYCDARDASAGLLVWQLQQAFARGVLYVDGGWASLVAGLRARAEEAGVELRVGAGAERILGEANCEGVELRKGERLRSAQVVAAVGPRALARLRGREAPPEEPVLAACLDVALAPGAPPRSDFLLGIDRPLYASVHSATAALAPGRGLLVHVLRYLRPAPGPVAAHEERELEETLARLVPDWRARVVHRRFLPRLRVAAAFPWASQGGLAGRPPVADPELPGLWRAGDWVGSEGWLLDGSLASAREAARAILAAAVARGAA